MLLFLLSALVSSICDLPSNYEFPLMQEFVLGVSNGIEEDKNPECLDRYKTFISNDVDRQDNTVKFSIYGENQTVDISEHLPKNIHIYSWPELNTTVRIKMNSPSSLYYMLKIENCYAMMFQDEGYKIYLQMYPELKNSNFIMNLDLDKRPTCHIAESDIPRVEYQYFKKVYLSSINDKLELKDMFYYPTEFVVEYKNTLFINWKSDSHIILLKNSIVVKSLTTNGVAIFTFNRDVQNYNLQLQADPNLYEYKIDIASELNTRPNLNTKLLHISTIDQDQSNNNAVIVTFLENKFPKGATSLFTINSNGIVIYRSFATDPSVEIVMNKDMQIYCEVEKTLIRKLTFSSSPYSVTLVNNRGENSKIAIIEIVDSQSNNNRFKTLNGGVSLLIGKLPKLTTSYFDSSIEVSIVDEVTVSSSYPKGNAKLLMIDNSILKMSTASRIDISGIYFTGSEYYLDYDVISNILHYSYTNIENFDIDPWITFYSDTVFPNFYFSTNNFYDKSFSSTIEKYVPDSSFFGFNITNGKVSDPKDGTYYVDQCNPSKPSEGGINNNYYFNIYQYRLPSIKELSLSPYGIDGQYSWKHRRDFTRLIYLKYAGDSPLNIDRLSFNGITLEITKQNRFVLDYTSNTYGKIRSLIINGPSSIHFESGLRKKDKIPININEISFKTGKFSDSDSTLEKIDLSRVKRIYGLDFDDYDYQWDNLDYLYTKNVDKDHFHLLNDKIKMGNDWNSINDQMPINNNKELHLLLSTSISKLYINLSNSFALKMLTIKNIGIVEFDSMFIESDLSKIQFNTTSITFDFPKSENAFIPRVFSSGSLSITFSKEHKSYKFKYIEAGSLTWSFSTQIVAINIDELHLKEQIPDKPNDCLVKVENFYYSGTSGYYIVQQNYQVKKFILQNSGLSISSNTNFKSMMIEEITIQTDNLENAIVLSGSEVINPPPKIIVKVTMDSESTMSDLARWRATHPIGEFQGMVKSPNDEIGTVFHLITGNNESFKCRNWLTKLSMPSSFTMGGVTYSLSTKCNFYSSSSYYKDDIVPEYLARYAAIDVEIIGVSIDGSFERLFPENAEVKSLSGGQIAGISIGVILVIALVVFLVVFFLICKKRPHKNDDDETSENEEILNKSQDQPETSSSESVEKNQDKSDKAEEAGEAQEENSNDDSHEEENKE